jgi:putative membrane protein
MFIEKADAAKIEAAIHQAEAKTRAELVAVVAPESDDYRYVMLAVAAILGLAAPFPWSLGVLAGDAVWAHSASLIVFLAVLALGQIAAVRRLIVPRSLMRRRAARNARSQFFAQRVRMTRERAGVLLFVSVFEHHVEIIADDNAAAAVPDAVWAEAVATFIAALKADGPTAGFIAAISQLEATLAERLPGDSADTDELPNRLIIL